VNKQELALLEKVFDREIEGTLRGFHGVFQSKSKLAASLAERGLLLRVVATMGRDALGAITVEGWMLSEAGRYAYCSSLPEPSRRSPGKEDR
jgi:hypothetical protein